MKNNYQYWEAQLQDYHNYSNITEFENSNTIHSTVFLTKTLTYNIRQFSINQEITIGTILLVSYMIAISKIKEINDICVGVIDSGRNNNSENIENALGPFMKVVPVRLKDIDQKEFLELCREVQQQVINGSYTYEFTYDLGSKIFNRNNFKLFDELFLYENYPVKVTHRKTLEILEHTSYDNNSFPLVTYFYHDHKEEKIEIETQILEKFCKKYLNVQAELENILNREFMINDSYEGDIFSKRILDSLKTNLNRTAIQFLEKEINYSQLLQKSIGIANYLIDSTDEIFVGIMMESSIDAIASILAVILSGKAYVPIDPKLPTSRIEYIINDSGINLIIKNSHIENLEQNNARVVDFNDINMQNSSKIQEHTIHEEAYMIYTSGSTGNPKGVVVSRKNIIGFLNWNSKYMEYTNNDIILQNHSLSFDNSIWEIFSAIFDGGKLVIPEDRRNIEEIILLIEKKKVTSLSVTPSQLNILIDYVEFMNPGALLSLTKLYVGSETVTYNIIKKVIPFLSSTCRIFNEYGPTEATITSSLFEIDYNNIENYKESSSLPIGTPIADNKFYILPEDGKIDTLESSLETGELYIGGDQVSKGYFRNTQKNNDNFKVIDGLRVYKTGDLVTFEDGSYSFLGRVDDQVKVRGFRIELGEIEAKLRKVEGVNEVVAIITTDNQKLNNSISVFFTSRDKLDISEIRQKLLQELPSYMMPHDIIQIDALPLNSNGKIDKKLLKKIDGQDLNHNVHDLDNQFEVEELFLKTLNTSRKNLKNSFVQLGGDSLKCAKLVGKLRQFDINISFSDLFYAESIEDLIKRELKFELGSNKTNTNNEDSNFYPLNWTQNEILVDCLEAQYIDNVYMQNITFSLDSTFSIDSLKKALSPLITLHKNVFSKLELSNNTFGLKSIEVDEFLDNWISFTMLDVEEFIEFIKSDFETGINIFKDSLIKVYLNNIQEKSYLSISFHQIILDGISINNLINELAVFLQSIQNGTKFPKIELLSFKEIENERNSRMEKIELVEENQIFQNSIITHKNVRTEFVLDKKFTANLNNFCKQNNLTINNMLFFIYCLFLSSMSEQENFVVGIAIDGRNPIIKNVYSAVGNFIQTLIFETEIIKKETATLDKIIEFNKKLIDLYEKSYKYNYRQEVKNYATAKLEAMYSYHGYSYKEYAESFEVTEIFDIDALPYPISLSVLPEYDEIKLIFDHDLGFSKKLNSFFESISDQFFNTFTINAPKKENLIDMVARICSETIGFEIADFNKTFVDFGFNSLTLAVVYRKLLQLDFKLNFGDLLKSRNLLELSQVLSLSQKELINNEVDSQIIKPLSNIQKEMLMSMIEKDDSLINIEGILCQQSIYKLREHLNVNDVFKNVELLIERHPTLRSSIDTENVVQVFDKKRFGAPVEQIVINNEEELQKVLSLELQKVSNLKSYWLFSILLLDYDGDESFVFTYNHLILDGLSEDIVLNELFKALWDDKHIEGENTNYLNWLDFQSGKDICFNSDYWEGKENLFSKVGTLNYNKSDEYSNVKGSRSFENEIYYKIKNYCKQNGITVNMLILTSLFYSLEKLSQSKINSIDVVSSDTNFSDLVGCTITSSPLIIENTDEIISTDKLQFELADLLSNIQYYNKTKLNFKSDILYSFESDNNPEYQTDEIISTDFYENHVYGMSINVIDNNKMIEISIYHKSYYSNLVDELFEYLFQYILNIFNKLTLPNIVEFADVDNELRNIVEDVWSDVLRLDDETIRHFDGKNFFDLGGNSLMLFQVAKRLLNNWNIKVSISELLSNILFDDLVLLIKKKQH